MKNPVQAPSGSLFGRFARRTRYAVPAIVLTVAGMVGGSAEAQLLHRYDFNTTNDVVGTANGVLIGTATLSGGALVTAGGNGTVNGGWGTTGPKMILDTNAVNGITNAFSIETWFSCSTGWPKYDSLYAFSDGTTGNTLLGVPVNGYSPWPSGVNIAGGGGTNNAGVFGIYLDTSTLHETVLTYDGTNFTYYIDGVLANYNGLQSSFTDAGFKLSNLPDVGINGGSPWGDPSLTGSTFDFRIYGQALTPAQISTIYGLGSDATTAAITNVLAPATSFTWNGAGANDNWSTGLNWIGGTAPALSGNSVMFAGSTRTTPSVDANYSVNGLTFSNNASSFTIGSGNGSTLTLAGDFLNNSTNAQALTLPLVLTVASVVNSPTNVTLSGVVSGSGGITKNGNGLLVLSTANTYSGATTVGGGAVKLGDANAAQNSIVNVNVSNGVIFANSIGRFNVGSLGGNAALALTDGSSPVTLAIGAGNAGSGYNGVLSGAGSLVKLGTGVFTIGNTNNTYTGGTIVSNGIVAIPDGLPAPASLSPFGTGNILVNNGGVIQPGTAPQNAFGSYRYANNITLDSGSINASDASHRFLGNLTVAAGGGTVGSTYDAPWEGFSETNFPKAIFFDGLLTGTGNLTVQATGFDTGNAWDTSCAVFTSQGSAAQNTYSGTVTVNPASGGGSYLYIAGPYVFANATVTLSGDNSSSSGRMGVPSLLFGNGSLDGSGYCTLGGLAGSGSLVLADTILFTGGAGYSNGIPVALTVGNNNASTSYSGIMSGSGSLIKVGSGSLTLGGANTYTGNTTINAGSLVLTGGWLASSNVTAAAGTTLDVSALGAVTLAGNQTLVNGGSIVGSIATSSGSLIYSGTVGGYGTNAISGDLNLASGSVAFFDLSTSAAGPNDLTTVGGTLTANGNIIHVKAPSNAVNLDSTTDYVLFSSANTIVGTFASAPVWDVAPANAGHYSIVTGANTVTLHYDPNFFGPSGAASATPATAVRNQTVLITVNATNGNPGVVSGVAVDASQIGGSSSVSLVSAGGSVWTNSVIVTPDTAPGSKTLAVTITDSASFSAIIDITLPVTVGNDVWNGSAADNNFSSNLNWTNQTAPGYNGDSLEFAGTTRLTPDMDNVYTNTGITFDAGAGAFNITSTAGNWLWLNGAGGVVNNSSNPQTFSATVVNIAPQTYNAAAGNIVFAGTYIKGGNLTTVTGLASTVMSGVVTGTGSLLKQGPGGMTVSVDSSWDMNEASSGGFSGPLIDQAGTLTFKGPSTHTVNGELVIGGVLTNGATGNNAKLVVDGATLNISSWLSIGRGNGTGAVSSDLVLTNGAYVTAQNMSAGYNGNNSANLPKGSITISDTSTLAITSGTMLVGESSGSSMTMNVSGSATVSAAPATLTVAANSGTGVLNLNGGTVSVGSLRVGSGANNTSTANGLVTVNSGTLSSEGDMLVGFAGSSSDFGKVVLNGGTINIATATKRWLIMNQWDTANSQFDVNGGNLNINANTDLRFAIGNNSGTNTFNLNGGAVTFYSDNATTVGGTGVVDMHQGNGGSVQNFFNLNGGTLSVSGVLNANNSGTRVFNFNGGTLRATTNNTAFFNLGTGSASAYVRTNGAVIDTAGFNVTVAQPLLHNPTGTDGGLTKIGNGTLTLSGVNTYTNTTTVSAGTLEVVQPTLSSVGKVSVASGAMLQLDFAVTNQVGGLVLGGSTQAPGVYNATTSPSFISGTGSLIVPSPVAQNPTNITFTVSGGSLSLTWPGDHLGWILQTNATSLTDSNAWFTYPGSSSTTNVNVPISPSATNVFFRLIKP